MSSISQAPREDHRPRSTGFPAVSGPSRRTFVGTVMQKRVQHVMRARCIEKGAVSMKARESISAMSSRNAGRQREHSPLTPKGVGCGGASENDDANLTVSCEEGPPRQCYSRSSPDALREGRRGTSWFAKGSPCRLTLMRAPTATVAPRRRGRSRR